MGADSLPPNSTLMSYDIHEQLCQDSLHIFISLFFKYFQMEKNIFVFLMLLIIGLKILLILNVMKDTARILVIRSESLLF